MQITFAEAFRNSQFTQKRFQNVNKYIKLNFFEKG